MKKLVALLLAVVLTLSVSVIAFAETASGNDKATVKQQGDADADVLVKITNEDTDPEDKDQNPEDVDPDRATYSVEIDASGVVFTYKISDISAYDPATHTYPGSWDKQTGDIAVKNDSNTSITVTPAINGDATTHGVTASLVNGNTPLSLGSAVGTSAGVSGTIAVSIEGTPDIAEDYTLTTVTLTIAGVEKP